MLQCLFACIFVGSLLEVTKAAAPLHKPPAPCRQTLHSTQNGTAYISELMVGSFMQKAILDTGSFEAVVLSEECVLCRGANYNSRKSETFRTASGTFADTTTMEIVGDWVKKKVNGRSNFANHLGTFMQNIGSAMKLSGNSKILQYGSGPVVGAVGTDNVYVPGCDDLVAKDFPILEVVAHGVVVLAAHELLTAIIGMGPGLANDMHKRLHHLLGAERFTYCFPKDVSGDGVIVWNDRDPRRRMPGSWLKPAKQIEMAGVNHWAVKLSKMTMFGGQLKNERDVGCNPSCGAILDTGTTMIAVDPVLYASVLNEWSKLNDCAQFHELPSLRFHLGNAEHILPPEAYIGVVVPCTYNPFTNACEEDESNDEALKNPNIFKMKQQHLLLNEKPLRDPTMFFSNVSPSDKKKIQLHARRTTVAANRSEKSKGRGVTCELLLMSSNFGVTQNGPMMILGMPFFRYHTTTFDVSGEKEWVRQLLAGESEDKIWPRGFNNARSRRKIFTRPAGSDCSEEQMTGKGSRPSRLSGGQHMSRRVPVYGANQLRKMFEKDTATLERHIANVAKYGW